MELGERQMTKRKDEIDEMEKKLRKLIVAIVGESHKKRPNDYMRKYMKLRRDFEFAKKVRPSLLSRTILRIRRELEELLEDIERLKRTELSVNRKKGGT